MKDVGLKIRDYIEVGAPNEQTMFLSGTKRKTAQMKYQDFIEGVAIKLNDHAVKYLEEDVKPKIAAAKDRKEISQLQIYAMTDQAHEFCLQLIEAQKNLNLVEQTFLLLDLIRAYEATVTKGLKALLDFHLAKIDKERQKTAVPSHIVDMHGRKI